MNIILEDGSAILNVSKLSSRSEIQKQRLFFEIGYKTDLNNRDYGSNWIRTGIFKEIKDPIKFRDGDSRLDDLEYIKHHNFVLSEG